PAPTSKPPPTAPSKRFLTSTGGPAMKGVSAIALTSHPSSGVEGDRHRDRRIGDGAYPAQGGLVERRCRPGGGGSLLCQAFDSLVRGILMPRPLGHRIVSSLWHARGWHNPSNASPPAPWGRVVLRQVTSPTLSLEARQSRGRF